MRIGRSLPATSILAGSILAAFATAAAAQVPEIRFARQFSMGYLQFNLMEHSVGTIKVKPADWKDLFFPEVHGLPGS